MLRDVPQLKIRKVWMSKMELILSMKAILMKLTGVDAIFPKH
jgi:hypothetical protein